MTAASLAELVEVSPQAISHYEKGRKSPGPDVLARIAAQVKLPEHFFLLPERDDDGATTFYRSMASATKGARARADRRREWLRDIVSYLSEFVEFPPVNLPDLDLPRDPLMLSDDEIEEAADSVRAYWRMSDGPIANTVLLLENQGVIVGRDLLGATTLDGLSRWALGDRPYLMIGVDKGTAVRWRFDAAHELGHLILHSHLTRDDLAAPERFKKIEQQAHRFAGAFLLPMATFGDDLFAINLDTMRSLKPKWRASIGTMIQRCSDVGWISSEEKKKLWINASRRGWKKHEPYDDDLEPETPRLLARAFDLLLEDGAQTAADIAQRLALPLSDIEALCSLPRGYLQDFSPVTLLLAPDAPTQTPDHATAAPVIPLRARG